MALQDILYLQAQEKAQENATGYGQAAILGAGIGGTVGLTMGDAYQRCNTCKRSKQTKAR